MSGFVVGSGIVEITARTDKLRAGYEQARKEAEAGAVKIGNVLEKEVTQGAVKAAAAVNKMGREIDDAADRAGRSIEDSVVSRLNRLSSVAGSAFGALAAGAASVVSADMVGRIGADLIMMASNAEEAENKFNVAFGSMAGAVRAWSEEASERMGRSGLAFRDAASQIALVTNALGATQDQVQEMATNLTERAVDIGSIFNVDDADAARAIVSALTGEAEGVKRFGAVVNEARVEVQLLANGIKGGAKEATEAEKAFARYQIIMQDTAQAHGDAERTGDGFANSSKRLQAAINELKVELGKELLPIVTQMVQGATDLVQAFNAMDPAARNMAAAAVAAVAVLGPAALAAASLLNTLRAIPGAAAAASASAGGAGVAANASRFGPVGLAVGAATLGGSVIVGAEMTRRKQNEIGANPEKATLAELEAERDRRRAGMNSFQVGPRGQVVGGNRYAQEYRAIQEELQRRYKAMAPAAPVSVATPTSGGSVPVPRTGGSGKGGGGATRIATETESDAAREAERAARERAAMLSATNSVLAGVEGDLQRATVDQAHAALGSAVLMADQMAAEEAILQLRIGARAASEKAVESEIAAQEEMVAKSKLSEEDKRLHAEMLDEARKRLETLKAENSKTSAAEMAAFQREWQARLSERQTHIVEADLEAQIEALNLSLAGVSDREQIRATQTQILAIERKRADALAEAAYQADLLAGYTAQEAEARRNAALKNNEARQQAGQSDVNRATESPMEAYLRQMREGLQDAPERAMVGLLDDLNSGLVDVLTNAEDAEDALKKMVRNFLIELVQMQLNKAFLALFGNGTGSSSGSAGGLVQAGIGLLSGIFGGKRASGGTVSAGMLYEVNENGREFFAPRTDGAIWNPAQLGQLAAGSQGARVVNVYADGYITEQVLRGMIADAMLQTGTATQASTITTLQRRTGRAFA